MAMALDEKVWSDIVYDDAIGKTKGTFDPINASGSGVKVQKKDAVDVLGFLVALSLTAVTDAELMPNAILRVSNKALGITNEDVVIPCGTMDADANNPYAPVKTYYVPFKIPENSQEKLFNSLFEFSIAPSSTNTGGFQPVVGVMYSNFVPDELFATELLAEKHRRVVGGAFSADAALGHTGAAAVAGTAITLTAGTKQILALLADIQPNGITAADPVCGWREFSSSGIPDFSPQKWPICRAWLPALGTVAEGAMQGGMGGRYYPTRFPLTGAEVSVSISSTIITTAAAAPDMSQAMLYDR